MMRTRSKLVGAAVVAALSALAAASVQAANLTTWSAADSLIDTTDYTGLAPWYWFANFNNSTPVTGAPMNQNEARKLPKWIHLETDPAFIHKDDSGANDDDTIRTGFSFSESPLAMPPVGSTSIGGQSDFNNLTLPDGTSGRSGQAVDSLSVTGNTSSMVALRILDGAPSSFQLWVVTDNGGDGAANNTVTNFQSQSRMRVNLRDTVGPPIYSPDSDTSEAEAKPLGFRLIEAGSDPQANNGIADAWAFSLSDVGTNDIIIIKPTSEGGIPGSRPAFAGFIITPEPSSVVLAALGLLGFGAMGLRRK